jgi:hypothetical protein
MAVFSTTLASRVSDANRRNIERVDVAIWTRIRMVGDVEFPARIGNISATGFMAATPCPIRDYAALHIELPRIGWLKATALWCLGDKIGGEFESVLDHDTFSKLRPFLG